MALLLGIPPRSILRDDRRPHGSLRAIDRRLMQPGLSTVPVKAQLQLPIRPFPPGVHGRRFIVRLGPERIEDRGPYQAQQRFALGISRVVPVQARPCAVVLPRQLPIITS
jgi:hypothetical protein